MNRRSLGFTVLRLMLGVLLIAAAGLKLFDDSQDPMDRVGLLASPQWRMAAIQVEAIFGLWLLTGALPHALWLTALLCFSLLAGVSFYLGLDGQPSCGCFGEKFSISPWYTLTLDLAAVAALLYWRPLRSYEAQSVLSAAVVRRILLVGAGSTAMFAVVLGGLTWTFGSPAEALYQLRGETITVEPYVSEVGDGHSGERRSFTIQVANHGKRPVRIVGGTTGCACEATRDLPVTIAAGRSQAISVWMAFRGKPGRFQHEFGFYTDDDNQPEVIARYAGRVTPSP